MNGHDQMQALTRLYGMTSLAGYRIGDHVTLPGIECTFRVTGFRPPVLLVLTAPSGRELTAGIAAVRRVRTRQDMEYGR